ncbi:hypothetical protein CMI47_13045 [Candidatus Pacearchaeota archaeon]|nr:hypothetical protein [Candidatus Pacearchaeota archaeon]|tara:strand:+ start:25990 stop:26262 length:273 start_codon:yes stop_codon:yes gene_type:complete
MTINEIKDEISKVSSLEDLRTIRNSVNTHYNTLSTQRKFDFCIGDRVMFHTRGGAVITGKVIKRMRKNIKVNTDSGVQWRVAPSLLKHVV